ncbi:MAG: hypothetical protein MI746_17815 [Pseudomonadales bacterium]|nr:hypothetical protein [Pseudomonadales bacterium]
MRSRYTAYKLGGYGEYLWRTWHPNTSKGLTPQSLSGKTRDWQSLEIVDTMQDGDKGGVEFRANYLDEHGELKCHHEMSAFVRVKGQWVYVDGKVQLEATASTA